MFLIVILTSLFVTTTYSATCNYGLSTSFLPGFYAENYCNIFDLGGIGSFDFQCNYSGSEPVGTFYYYNTQDCSGNISTTIPSPTNYTDCCENCNDNCVVTSVLGELHEESGNCDQISPTEWFLFYVMNSEENDDIDTCIGSEGLKYTLTLDKGYIGHSLDTDRCDSNIVYNFSYGVGCQQFDSSSNESVYFGYENVDSDTTTPIPFEGYSTCNYGVDVNGYFFIPGVYPEGQCSYFDLEFAVGSFQFVCKGSGGNRHGVFRVYENIIDCSGSNYTEEELELYDCSDTSFSVACDTLILEGIYFPGIILIFAKQTSLFFCSFFVLSVIQVFVHYFFFVVVVCDHR